MKVGITGNIGSGKTTVCKIFETLHIPVYYADLEAKRLMTQDLNVKEKIKLLFGLQAYDEEEQLDRAYLSKIVFNNPQMLSKLNFIIHPAVRIDSQQWANRQKKVPYTLKEAALIIESDSYTDLDKLIVVTAPLETRINRVMSRDQVDRESVLARESKQMPEQEKINYADFVIQNDGQNALIPQVHAIHQQLLALV